MEKGEYITFTIYKSNMEKGPQYISSILRRVHNALVQYRSVHNTLVQYGKRSTIYPFNTERCPQYISSTQKSVHNTLVQYRKVSTIHFNTEVSTIH